MKVTKLPLVTQMLLKFQRTFLALSSVFTPYIGLTLIITEKNNESGKISKSRYTTIL